MGTIDNKALIDKLIENNGFFPNEPGDEGTPDPRVYMIVSYMNAYNARTWAITYENEPSDMLERYLVETVFVRDPKVIWRASDHPVGDIKLA